MRNRCFAIEFGAAEEGRSHRLVVTYGMLLTSFVVLLSLVGGTALAGSKLFRLTYQALQYSRLQQDFEHLRSRYQELQRQSRQHTEQMATLENLASEVSVAYGLSEPSPGDASMDSPGPIAPNVNESIEEYNFLKAASFGQVYRRSSGQWLSHTHPSIWPASGTVRSVFGRRLDPFSGEGAFHTGVDVATARGTPVHATADGIVVSAAWAGSYGKLVVLDHGKGLQTYYAHLSTISVIPGQEVHTNEVIALSGSTGRSTGPHVHYEVRLAGTPVNPMKFLPRTEHPPARTVLAARSHAPVYNDFGL